MKIFVRSVLGSPWRSFAVFAGLTALVVLADWSIDRRSLTVVLLVLTGLSYLLLGLSLSALFRRREWLKALLNVFFLLLGALLFVIFDLWSIIVRS